MITQRRKRIVLLNPMSTTYRQQVDQGHIIKILVLWANGDFSKCMIVVQSKSIKR
jgi:hypothetical protein